MRQLGRQLRVRARHRRFPLTSSVISPATRGYFAERLPGVLTSRITATSNAFFAVENMFVWNVLPPCVATIAAIALVTTVSTEMAAALILIAGVVVYAHV